MILGGNTKKSQKDVRRASEDTGTRRKMGVPGAARLLLHRIQLHCKIGCQFFRMGERERTGKKKKKKKKVKMRRRRVDFTCCATARVPPQNQIPLQHKIKNMNK